MLYLLGERHRLSSSELSFLTYADVCWRMLTYADVCWRMLTYADICWRMLTYADVCWRMLTYARYSSSELSFLPTVSTNHITTAMPPARREGTHSKHSRYIKHVCKRISRFFFFGAARRRRPSSTCYFSFHFLFLFFSWPRSPRRRRPWITLMERLLFFIVSNFFFVLIF